jgi:hypothetical protein
VFDVASIPISPGRFELDLPLQKKPASQFPLGVVLPHPSQYSPAGQGLH